MLRTRYTPTSVLRPYSAIGSEFEEFLSGVFNSGKAGTPSDWVPKLSLFEKDSQYEVSVDLPGLEKDDIEISLAEGVLTIKGSRSLDKSDDKAKYLVVEREYGKFVRAIRFPRKVNGEAVTASFNQGVLKITVPKKEEQTQRIEIEQN
ncbi:MAG: Hsp20/alpha crystallin family protein [Nitrospinota bacterium]